MFETNTLNVRHLEKFKQEQEDEQVVHGQAKLHHVACKELQRLVGSKYLVNTCRRFSQNEMASSLTTVACKPVCKPVTTVSVNFQQDIEPE